MNLSYDVIESTMSLLIDKKDHEVLEYEEVIQSIMRKLQ